MGERKKNLADRSVFRSPPTQPAFPFSEPESDLLEMNTLSLNKPISMPALQLTPWVFVIQSLSHVAIFSFVHVPFIFYLHPDQEGS